jgi:hypothetical protein
LDGADAHDTRRDRWKPLEHPGIMTGHHARGVACQQDHAPDGLDISADILG